MKKNIFILALFVIVLMGLSYVTLSPKKQVTQETKTIEESLPLVRIGTASASDSYLIYQIMKMQEFDKKNGFELEIKDVSVENSALSLLSDEVDVANISPSVVTQLVADGKDIQMFYPTIKTTCPFLVKADSGLETLDDLKGKRIGTLAKSSGLYQTLQVIYAQRGEVFEDYYSAVTVAGIPALPGLLLTGDVDVINTCVSTPYAKLMAGGKVREIGMLSDMLKSTLGENTEIMLVGLASKSDWISKNQELVSDFKKANDDAIDYIKNNSDAVLANQEVINNFGIAENETEYRANFMKESLNFGNWEEVNKGNRAYIDAAYKLQILKSPYEPKAFGLQE